MLQLYSTKYQSFCYRCVLVNENTLTLIQRETKDYHNLILLFIG